MLLLSLPTSSRQNVLQPGDYIHGFHPVTALIWSVKVVLYGVQKVRLVINI
jgi:hypothetical protein